MWLFSEQKKRDGRSGLGDTPQTDTTTKAAAVLKSKRNMFLCSGWKIAIKCDAVFRLGTYSFSTKVPGNERFLLYKYLYSGVWSRQVQALRKNRLLSLSPPPHSNPEETRHQGGRRGFLRIIELVRRRRRRLVGAGCRTWPSSCRGTSRWTASGSNGFATSPWRTS